MRGTAGRLCAVPPAQTAEQTERFDPAAIRGAFPALAREQDGRPVVYVDGPGGTQVPRSVIDAMVAYLERSNANSHGAFGTSAETDAVLEAAHRGAADLLGARPDEVVFGPNATSLLFAVSRAIGRTLSPGDEVVVTRLDHDANVRPWVRMAEDAGATVRWVDLRPEDATLDLGSFEAALSPKTKVVAFTLASNAVGSRTPAAALAARAHAVGALVAMDAVHATPHGPIDVAALGADLLACSPYKFFGPHLGTLFARRELLASWPAYKVRPATDESPGRWETGTQNHEGLAGLVATIDYLEGLAATGSAGSAGRRERLVSAMGRIEAHEARLSERFLRGIADLPGVELFGIADPGRVTERCPTFAIRVAGEHPRATAERLAARGIYVWDGNYYALELMERLGLQDGGGAVRIGFCHYTTEDEVDRVLADLVP
jgi:cysteine desulfurase family protein (TIGR01976 family)